MYNDIVYIKGGNNKITYTGGRDYYYSSAGNDIYNVNSFNQDTTLSVTDSKNEGVISLEDELIINTSISDLSLFFDLEYKDGNVINSENTELYFLNGSVSLDINNYKKIVSCTDAKGFVEVNNYFADGRIESVVLDNGEEKIYYTTDMNINKIKSAVAGWFADYGSDYNSVYDAFSDSSNEHITELVSAFVNINENS